MRLVHVGMTVHIPDIGTYLKPEVMVISRADRIVGGPVFRVIGIKDPDIEGYIARADHSKEETPKEHSGQSAAAAY